ncbi:transcriptional regulator, GntR family [Syntrophobotulus glycolicus DSM 8271]|uniref:Transcriptional regulator, GntR family n=1 Tax=Syntrophobotulus glycolicus (strain DSM 8271 / FlGlyR) TaxID=645991 RepID=F0SZ07_SYNGF|nr:GntR family transcriptional regulator [Syntrophobotulus glycolicus]ADY56044.1 transcriptional regulator, GntR family [Syntrophobotulus glycolicus DSM 8271]
MILNSNSIKPIYLQIADWLEAEILAYRIIEDERIYSQYQLAGMFNINPATAAKGLNILADKKVIYKKRGLGMFVAPSAREIILKSRKDQVLGEILRELIRETERLGIPEEQLIEMIREAKKNKGEED